MCGIAAIFSYSGQRPVDTLKLKHSLDQLSHRGPDGRTIWSAPGKDIALGHARLSIIDLVTGTQPIANEDGSLRIVVNAEFYGHDTHPEILPHPRHNSTPASH